MLRKAVVYLLAITRFIGAFSALPFFFVASAIGSFVNVIWLGFISGWKS